MDVFTKKERPILYRRPDALIEQVILDVVLAESDQAGFVGSARAAEAAAANFWNIDNWFGRLAAAAAAIAVAVAVAAHNCCDIVGCIEWVVERQAVGCTELVLRESAYRLAAEAPDLFVRSVDTESTDFAVHIEAQWVLKVPNSVLAAAEDEQSDRDIAARPISA